VSILGGDSEAAPSSSRRNETPKLWSLAEKTRLERGLMMHGYARWDKIMGMDGL
jgi:hypothetical protein